MVMQIRPPNVWQDSNTNAAVDFKVYISQPNTDPKDPSKQLSITDSASGEVVSNYFVINPDGYAKNQNGQGVLPVIQEQEYAILFESVGGGQQWAYPHVKGDAFGLTGGGTGTAMVDEVYNNFPAAQAADLTAFDLIFIQSKEAGWEGTAVGPEYSYYSYYTGNVGAPGTGTFDLFYDSEGNEWKITENSQLPLTNEDGVATNAAAIAVNAANIVAITKIETVVSVTDLAWTPNAGAYAIEFSIAGGGGGGGPTNILVGSAHKGGGGGGGGWCRSLYSETVEASYAITVGAGGVGGIVGVGGDVGGDGGDTSVVAGALNLQAFGGEGGGGTIAGGGTSSGGGLNLKGGDSISQSGLITYSGGSMGSGGLVSPTGDSSGFDGFGPGCGGSGASDSTNTSNQVGGAGTDGVVIITEYLK